MAMPSLRRVVSFVGIALSLTACHRQGAIDHPVSAPAANVAIYDGLVSLDPTEGRIKGTWNVRLSRADSVAFLLNASLSISAVTGRDVLRFTSSTDRDLQTIVVYLAPRANAKEADVRIVYDGRFVATDDGMNQLTAPWIELGIDSFWFPVVADLARDVLGRVQLVLPRGYRVAASGDLQQRDDTTIITNTRPLPDFAFVASSALNTSEVQHARTHYTSAPVSVRERISSTTTRCVDYLNARYGQRVAITTADVVLAPRTGPGYARQRYVVIPIGAPASSSSETTDSRLRFICHEFAHFWSNGAAVAGQDNWLNEGFAEFVAGRAVRTLEGEAAWDLVLASWRTGATSGARAAGPLIVWTPSSTTRPSFAASYRKAPALLSELESRIGSARMETLLTRYMTEPLRTTQRVLDMIDTEAGAEHGRWFRDALGR
ncbi:MAG: hypothetical protein IT353_24500 [Gemmatimonadaceae bacterium]|nr:hypothetical protein [Gemmatimonadaceae bacterium]